MKFYLAGPFVSLDREGVKYPDWRDFVIGGVKKHQFSDPRKNDQSCPARFTMQDLEGVINADGIFVYRPLNGEIIGGAWEQGIAVGASYMGKNIPSIYVDEHSFPFPLLSASSKRTFSDLDASLVYLNFLDSWDNEFQAINQYLDWESKR